MLKVHKEFREHKVFRVILDHKDSRDSKVLKEFKVM